MNDNNFDTLLNELVPTWGAMKADEVPFRTYTSQGCTYQIPQADSPAQYTLDSLTLFFGDGQLYSSSRKRELVLPESSDDNALSLSLVGLNPDKGCPDPQKMLVALYQRGTSVPLATLVYEADDDFLTLYPKEEKPLSAGDYFLLVWNARPGERSDFMFDLMGGCLRYSFTLLPHGAELPHPLVEEVAMESAHELDITLGDPYVEGRDCFSLQVYNSSWRLMAEYDGLPFTRRSSRNVSVMLPDEEWWLDDSYTIIFYHNNEPFSVCTYDWSDGQATSLSHYPLEPGHPLHLAMKRLRTSSHWAQLGRIPGLSQVKEGIFHFLPSLSDSSVSHIALITSLPHDEAVVRAIVGCLNPAKTLNSCDCGDLLYLMDGEEYIWDVLTESCLCLYNIGALLTPEGGELLHALERKIETNPEWQLLLWGTSEEMERLFVLSELFFSNFPTSRRWHFQPYTLSEVVNECRRQVEEHRLCFSFDGRERLVQVISANKSVVASWQAPEIAQWIENELLPRFRKRVLDTPLPESGADLFVTIEPSDIVLTSVVVRQSEYETHVAELNAMVGLGKLKKSLMATFHRTRFEENRRRYGLPVASRGGHHMIFTGNPGTGKTTVAKMVGRIFHSLGLLSKGEVIEAERANMVGRYIGETEQNMEELLEKAKGNVLFIDEAYSLCDNSDGDRKDYGCRVLESLLTVLSKKDPDMIVIMAGYEKEMQQMLELNPGMKGRFPYKFNFEDYNADELFQIALHLLERSEYCLTPDAERLFRETICDALLHKDAFFHNARWIEQYVQEGILSAMAERVMNLPPDTSLSDVKSLYINIEEEDIRVAYQNFKPNTLPLRTSPRRIGFVA